MIKERWEPGGDKYMEVLQNEIDELVVRERIRLQAESEAEMEDEEE